MSRSNFWKIKAGTRRTALIVRRYFGLFACTLLLLGIFAQGQIFIYAQTSTPVPAIDPNSPVTMIPGPSPITIVIGSGTTATIQIHIQATPGGAAISGAAVRIAQNPPPAGVSYPSGASGSTNGTGDIIF